MRLAKSSLAITLAVAVASSPAWANHWWGGYRWATMGGGLSVKVNAALTGTWSTYVGVAVTSDWEQSDALSLGSVNASSASRKKCSPISGEILVCNDAYGLRGWLGIASIWTDSKGHIAQATTKLNDSYFSLASYSSPAWHRLVACQEIGHDFGLAHQDETFANTNLGSCMDYTNAPAGGLYNGVDYGPSNEHPNAHDYDELRIIYLSSTSNDGYVSAHPPSYTNFGVRDFTKPPVDTPLSAQPAGDSPAEWGRAIHTDSLGRPDYFVKGLGQGQEVFTHVFWAPDTRRADIQD